MTNTYDEPVNTKTIKTRDPDELRDLLPSSGVFEMLDCEVEIYCPEMATADDIQKMVTTIESMINVTDVRVSATPETFYLDHYRITITEVQPPYSNGLFNRGTSR